MNKPPEMTDHDWEILIEMLHSPIEPTGLFKEAYDTYMMHFTKEDEDME